MRLHKYRVLRRRHCRSTTQGQSASGLLKAAMVWAWTCVSSVWVADAPIGVPAVMSSVIRRVRAESRVAVQHRHLAVHEDELIRRAGVALERVAAVGGDVDPQ